MATSPTNPAFSRYVTETPLSNRDFNLAAAIPPGKAKRPPLLAGLIRRHNWVSKRADIIDENLHAIANLHRANATRRARDDDVARQ